MITDRCWACERSSDEPHAEDCEAEIDRDVAEKHQPWCGIAIEPSVYLGTREVGSAWCSCGRRRKNRRNEPNRRELQRRAVLAPGRYRIVDGYPKAIDKS